MKQRKTKLLSFLLAFVLLISTPLTSSAEVGLNIGNSISDTSTDNKNGEVVGNEEVAENEDEAEKGDVPKEDEIILEVEVTQSDLDKAKEDAKADIESVYLKKLAGINSLELLADELKQELIEKLESAKVEIISEISAAETIEAVHIAKENGLNKISSIVIPLISTRADALAEGATTVSTVDELKAAIANKDINEIVVTKDIEISEQLEIGRPQMARERPITIKGVSLNEDGTPNITLKGIGSKAYMFDIRNTELVKFENLIFDGNNQRSAIYSNNINLEILNSKFINNTSSGTGAMNLTGEGNTTIKNSYFIDNKNPIDGGAIYFNSTSGDINIENTIFKNNEARFAGALYLNNVVGVNKLNIKNSAFEGNKAVGPGYNPTGWGGAISFEGFGELNIDGSKFNNNIASDSGAAIHVKHQNYEPLNDIGLNVNINNTEFNKNLVIIPDSYYAYFVAGAVDIFGAGADCSNRKVTINNSKFLGNSNVNEFDILGFGGALTIRDAKGLAVDINKTEFKSNEATQGGAIFSNSGNINIQESNFNGNNAVTKGGAINILPFTDRKTTDGDSVYYNTLKVSNTEFSDNTAGDGIFELDKTEYPNIFSVYETNITNIKSLSKPANINKNIAYNNYDISFVGDKPIDPIEEFTVTYNGNTNDSGTVPTDTKNPYAKNSEVTVLPKGDLSKTGYTFKGWNTKADGSGTSYKVGDKFKITANTTLYAQWEKDSEDSGTGWTWSGGSSTTSKEKPKTEEILTHIAYLTGYPDNTIRPQVSITRAEVAAIFARLKVGEANIPSATTKYNDVNASDWYTKYIAFVTDNNIMEGYPDGSFKPNDKITRAEFTAVVARYNSLADTTSTFEDVIGHWAEKYIGAVTSKGWINGYPDGTFKPEKDISREEVATMVNKMLDRKVDKDGLNNLSIKNFKDLDNSSWSYFDIVEASNSHKSVRRTLGNIMENWRELL
ncbi:Listeria/Bacterioides repeat-containing protein [Anaerosphaera aminiphila DSM 21120]|uniref:Listeria/Bacterioides repeat-containing protein n=1 Tax=Anaerosphaera aminiphila DSM 21120 TaxID=1120995 RepID=A0A1M5V1Y3_9FIRM|nr:S-layer homology domain-containing protein [Anaerosphaera aminiphila]SHH69164.1 Listeria/Bacterioides repeat-containing protein [Anaerosphaera aminiphila DSM 21120]